MAPARRVSRRYESKIEEQNDVIRAEQAKSERLLLNILPAPVAAELKSGRETIAERHTDVTVLFADIVGFTALSSAMAQGLWSCPGSRPSVPQQATDWPSRVNFWTRSLRQSAI